MTNPSQELIQANNISIGYHGRHIGSGISFSLYANEILCLLGPNGSGKSTLFKSLLGLLPIDYGSVIVNNQDLKNWSRSDLARFLAYVPQAQTGIFPFQVKDVVLMGRHARIGMFSAPSATDIDCALSCLETLDILHLQNKLYTEISGGEQQLVLIARALAQEPQAIIMDEPTASLDFSNQAMVLRVIQSLRQSGIGVLFCTHQPNQAIRVADRVALFAGGTIRSIGNVQTTLSIASLASLYGMEESTVKWFL